MISQSCFDIKVIANELNNDLANSRIEKFYNTPDCELLIKGYSGKKGKFTIRALRGECIHLTDYKRDVAENPSGFTMLIRKYLNNSMILEIYQPFFERIVIFKIKKEGIEYNLVIELFAKGNVVICANDLKIIGSLKAVKADGKFLRTGDIYDFSKPVFLESFLDRIEFKRIIKSSELESAVKTVAIKLGVGGRYAEEVCFIAGVEYSKNPGILSDDEVEKLFKAFTAIYMNVKHYKNISPCAYEINDEIANYSPFPFSSMQDAKVKNFESFSAACDYYYSSSQIVGQESVNKGALDSKISQISSRLMQQEAYAKELESESIKLAGIGKTIFDNNQLINNILQKLRNAKISRSWDEIINAIESEKSRGIYEATIIDNIAPTTGEISLKIGDDCFAASINDDAFKLSGEFFDKSKKLKAKIQGALASAANSRLMIEDIKREGFEPSSIAIKELKPEKKWFEKFRWLKTSNDFLLVCGKDASQNEIVVKKIAEPNDLIFHASVSGSPFGILKDGLNAGDIDKEESANFVLCFSRAWRESIMSDVFSVGKEQVSKTAPSGEYVEHGSFVISGSKNYYTGLKLEVALGIDDGKVIAGPIDLISKRCKKICLLKPGGIAPGKIAKRLIELFDEKNISSEDYLAFIPGDSMIEII